MSHESYTIKAERREQKKRPRMRKHGQSLKRKSTRPIKHIHKAAKKRA